MKGKAWHLPFAGVDRMTIHPAHIVDRDHLLIVRMAQNQSTALPEAGGFLDQSALNMHAIEIAARVAAELAEAMRPKGKR